MSEEIELDAEGFGPIACEWQREFNDTATTSCGVRIRYPDEHRRCPKCMGRIVEFDYEHDDDDWEYFDDANEDGVEEPSNE